MAYMFDVLYGAKGIASTAACRIQAEARADAEAWTFTQTTIRPVRRCDYCGSRLEALRCASCGAPDRGPS